MAKVFRCDRCNEYEHDGRNGYLTAHTVTVRVSVVTPSHSDYDSDDKSFELCGTCSRVAIELLKTAPPKHIG